MEYRPNLAFVNRTDRQDYIPDIKPIKNWKTGIQEFYKNKGKEKIEKDANAFATSLAGIFGKPEMQLKWNKEKGLDGIVLSMQADITLNEYENWQEHNMNTKDSILAMAILINYYSELSKYIRK